MPTPIRHHTNFLPKKQVKITAILRLALILLPTSSGDTTDAPQLQR
jgi:hypothetical protein